MVNAKAPAKGKGGIPIWAWAVGGGAVLLLLLTNRKGGVTVETGGLLASEVSNQLDRQREATEAALERSREEFSALLDSKLAAAPAAPAKTELEAQRGLLAQILAALQTKPAGAPAAPAAPASSVPLPTFETIRAWETGINLPEGWGSFFVLNFGRLPSSIAELEQWRAQKAIPTAAGGWCIPWGGELKCI